jgi:hypothetical protein
MTDHHLIPGPFFTRAQWRGTLAPYGANFGGWHE